MSGGGGGGVGGSGWVYPQMSAICQIHERKLRKWVMHPLRVNVSSNSWANRSKASACSRNRLTCQIPDALLDFISSHQSPLQVWIRGKMEQQAGELVADLTTVGNVRRRSGSQQHAWVGLTHPSSDEKRQTVNPSGAATCARACSFVDPLYYYIAFNAPYLCATFPDSACS